MPATSNDQVEGGALTAREQEVLGLTLRGLGTKTIADRLGICVRTVVFHRANLWLKLSQDGKVRCRRCMAVLEAEGAPGV